MTTSPDDRLQKILASPDLDGKQKIKEALDLGDKFFDEACTDYGFQCYETAAELGSLFAQRYVGVQYCFHRELEKFGKGIQLLEMAATQGQEIDQYYLYRAYLNAGKNKEADDALENLVERNFAPALYRSAMNKIRVARLKNEVLSEADRSLVADRISMAIATGHLPSCLYRARERALGGDGVLQIPQGILEIFSVGFAMVRRISRNTDDEKVLM